jgi:endonuclease/exonuclease/phosphatase family metal-dependent hydrolase
MDVPEQSFKKLVNKYQGTDEKPVNDTVEESTNSSNEESDHDDETNQTSELNEKTDEEVPTESTPEIEVTKRQLQHASPFEKIRALTYNIWFSDEKRDGVLDRTTRTLEIIRQIRKARYEIIGLQEVVKETYELISTHLKKHYHIFQVFLNENLQYGDCLLLARDKIDIVEPYYYDHEKTMMSRKIIGCEIRLKNTSHSFHVLNTHLESNANNRDARVEQFATIERVVTDHKIRNVILLGDFNIASTQEPIEDAIKQSIFSDAWIEIGCPLDVKWTYDGRRNPHVKKDFCARFDRVLYHFDFDHLVTQLRLVGVTQEMSPPSDHFGVMAEFVLNRNQLV